MKKIYVLITLGLFGISCHHAVSEQDIKKLNGYWEIQKVEMPDGTKKEYKVNETIDFFKLDGKKGFRMKVMPQLDGKYLTNDIREALEISKSEENYYIEYHSNYGKWKEEILDLQDSIMVLKNKDNTEYHYVRQTPFSIK
ncbi:hypothetical protein [Flavobacterium aciduliphilum]|uniref:Lipocalin-like protein n=1 Tax=Flavobacterium aciduliphilum TaxID=1101402 RepID=A0A328YPV2_9FLAO|nr:hypothetical protein [Flavobacterium aciduliphilum]RAR75640.1 hypothetical protein CLV55_101340 [Flavobacterium aciduliphilum]